MAQSSTNISQLVINKVDNMATFNAMTKNENEFYLVPDTNAYFTNVVVSTSQWIIDNTYTGFGYKAELICENATSDMSADVIFGHAETVSGNYSPICVVGDGMITIYSKVNVDVTIPLIKVEGLGAGGTIGYNNLPQLYAPTITLTGNTLTIINSASNGDFVTGYKIYDNSALAVTTQIETVDLSEYISEAGSHTVTVKVCGENFTDSEASNGETYVIIPQLPAPAISASGTIVSYTAVVNATTYEVYADGASIGTTALTSIDVTTLSGWVYLTSGSHSITVKAKADGYADSDASNAVSVTKATSGSTVTVNDNAGETTRIYDGDNTTMLGIGSGTYQITSGVMRCTYLEMFRATVSYTGGVSGASTFTEGNSYSLTVTGDGTVTINGR